MIESIPPTFFFEFQLSYRHKKTHHILLYKLGERLKRELMRAFEKLLANKSRKSSIGSLFIYAMLVLLLPSILIVTNRKISYVDGR
jgi:hypothetical protein